MYRIFQNLIDCLSSASNSDTLRDAISQAAAGLDLSCFAYLSVPDKTETLISNYPSAWTSRYWQRHYERFDPVVIQALSQPEPIAGRLTALLQEPVFPDDVRRVWERWQRETATALSPQRRQDYLRGGHVPNDPVSSGKSPLPSDFL
jgi:autoinducer binding domain-containing protein